MQLMNNNKQLVDKNKDDLENIGHIIVRKYQKNLLIKELNDIFVQEYIKNQTPETQGVWISDLSRLSYIIKEQNEEKVNYVHLNLVIPICVQRYNFNALRF